MHVCGGSQESQCQWHNHDGAASGRPSGSTYLQEALSVLQQVEATVTTVVLLGDPAAGAPHAVSSEEAGRPPSHLPLHLQVAADATAVLRGVSELPAAQIIFGHFKRMRQGAIHDT